MMTRRQAHGDVPVWTGAEEERCGDVQSAEFVVEPVGHGPAALRLEPARAADACKVAGTGPLDDRPRGGRSRPVVVADRLEDHAAAPAVDGPRDPLQADISGALRRQVAHQPVDGAVADDAAAEPLRSGRMGQADALARFVDRRLVARLDLERARHGHHGYSSAVDRTILAAQGLRSPT